MSHIFTIRTQYTPEYQRSIEAIVSNHFDSFNIYRGTGYWKGQKEDSLTVEIIGRADQRHDVREVAKAIRVFNDQEAVYFTMQQIDATLITVEDGQPSLCATSLYPSKQ